MGSRFRNLAFALTAAAAALLALPATALAEPGSWAEVPSKLPKPAKGDKTKNLDFLFEALKVAPDAESAKMIEDRIWALWFVSGSDTADLLMSRVKTAVDGNDSDLALKLLDSIVEIRPEYVEAWNRRATVHFMKKDYTAALNDLRQVLAREPRHFGALMGLGMILQEFGNEKKALEIYRRILSLHPRMQRVIDLAKNLTEKVDGRDI